MYTISKDTKIDNTLLNDVINYNEQFTGRYDRLEKYYFGQHDIVNRTKEDTNINNKVVVNHAKYITDVSVGYLLGNPVDYQASKGYEIQPILDAYKKQTINDLDTEIAKDVSIFGLQREYIYVNADSEPRSCEIDNRNSIIVYDDTVEHNKLFGLIYRPIYEGTTFKYWDILFVDDKKIVQYHSSDKSLDTVGKEKPHSFGKVPIVEYKNNPEFLGDFEPVISLIDAYNILQSDRINDKEQLVDAILCMYGIDFDEEQAEMLKESRMLANIPTDAKVEYLVKQLNESDVDILRGVIEEDIHKISMVPNMSDENFANNTSGVAIRYKLLSFEQHTKNKERYMEKGLMERFELYNNFLASISKMSIVPKEEVDAVFKRNLPNNDFETSQMINNLSDHLCNETLISQLSFVKDAVEENELYNKEEEQTAPKEEYSTNEIIDMNKIKEPIEEETVEEE